MLREPSSLRISAILTIGWNNRIFPSGVQFPCKYHLSVSALSHAGVYLAVRWPQPIKNKQVTRDESIALIIDKSRSKYPKPLRLACYTDPETRFLRHIVYNTRSAAFTACTPISSIANSGSVSESVFPYKIPVEQSKHN